MDRAEVQETLSVLRRDRLAAEQDRAEAERALEAASKRATTLDRLIEGYIDLFPELATDSAAPTDGQDAVDYPRGQDAVLKVMEAEESEGRYWTVAAMTEELTARGWLPKSGNPATAVRTTMARVADAHADRVQRGKGEHGLVYYYRHDHMSPPRFRQEADVDPRPSPVAPLTSTDETPPATDGGPASGTVVGTEGGGDEGASGEEPAMPSGDEYVTGLVSAAANGDKSAWNALVERYGSMVWAIARQYRLDTADAADVSQTTWLRLVEHLHRIEQPERVGGWLATTARRESLRVLRLSGRQVPSSADLDRVPDTPSSSALDHDLISGEQGRHVRDLVDQLPERSRMLLHLLSAESPLSYKRISEALSMPIGSIGPTRARALEKLRKLAVDAGFNPEDAFLTG